MEDSPLNKQQYIALQKMGAAIAEAEKHCDRAEAGGTDCADLRAMAQLYRQRQAQIKQAFFPDRP